MTLRRQMLSLFMTTAASCGRSARSMLRTTGRSPYITIIHAAATAPYQLIWVFSELPQWC